MRNCCFFVITVMLAAAGAGSVACSDDNDSSSPLQPSPLTNAPAGAGPRGFAGGPPAGADAAGGGIAQLAPVPDEFNAYNAQIEYVDGEVTITFVPVDMPRMPPAAGAHRNRAVTVRHCPVEPHHVGQVCGDGAPVFQDSFAFMGSPSRTFTLPECSGWLVIEAAELSDDRYDGWRNAPLSCRTDDQGRTVTSVDTDGNGDGWDGSRFDPPARAESEAEQEEQEAEEAKQEAERVQRAVNEAIAAAIDDDDGRLEPDTDPVSVNVNELFTGTAGTTGDDYRATSSDPAVATVEITPNPRVKITPVGPGTTTIRVDNLRSAERVEFTVTVERPGNRPPAITDPGNKAYVQRQMITAFPIAVTDADGDTVTVTVTGLPAGLTYSSETKRVSGTVAADAEAKAYTVTVTANDGTNDDVTDTFTITIGIGNMPPTIGTLTDRSYDQGQTIGAFSIEVTDQDDTEVTVTVTGLPDGLTWSSEMVSGTVATDATARDYTVTVTANDGTNDDVTDTFTITVAANSAPTITIPEGERSYERGEEITAFTIAVTDTDAGDAVTVTVEGLLPKGLMHSDPASGPVRVSGTVAADAEPKAYEVTVTASDGVARATVTFTITVTPWPVNVAIPSISGSRLVIQRPGSDGWSRGSCRFGETEPVWNTAWNHPNRRDPRGPTCVVHVKSAEVRNREYRFWYATSGNHVVGPPNEPFCHGLNTSGNLNSEGRPGNPNPLNPPSSAPAYAVTRWVCQTRDWSPGTGYAPGRIRNVSFNTAARQLEFQINFGTETIGRPVFIEFELRNYPGVGQWSSQIRAVSEDFVYKSFPD